MIRLSWICARRCCAVVLATSLTLIAGCSGGGIADGGDATVIELNLVAYAAPESGWSTIIPAFAATPAGKGVVVNTSYGASGSQADAVADGAPADIVNFSAEPDVTRLVDEEMVPSDWNSDVTHGIPFGSVVSFMVREGNPKNVRDWDDLLQPGLEVVTPSPLSSGSAKWNLLAPYAAKSRGGENPEAGLAFVNKLLLEHVGTAPESASAATDLFLGGTGDVLLSNEHEAIRVEREGGAVEYVNPPQTMKIENPVAVLASGPHLKQAVALKNFLYTPEGQRIWAEVGFRPVDPAVAQEFSSDFPSADKLWTIDDLGGWASVDPVLFDEDNGAITRSYRLATG